MSKNTVWISEAMPNEQGSFSELSSKHTYGNGDIIEAVRQESNALDRGDDVAWTNASIDPNVVYEVAEDQRFNIYLSQTDSQGVSHPSKYAPGR